MGCGLRSGRVQRDRAILTAVDCGPAQEGAASGRYHRAIWHPSGTHLASIWQPQGAVIPYSISCLPWSPFSVWARVCRWCHHPLMSLWIVPMQMCIVIRHGRAGHGGAGGGCCCDKRQLQRRALCGSLTSRLARKTLPIAAEKSIAYMTASTVRRRHLPRA